MRSRSARCSCARVSAATGASSIFCSPGLFFLPHLAGGGAGNGDGPARGVDADRRPAASTTGRARIWRRRVAPSVDSIFRNPVSVVWWLEGGAGNRLPRALALATGALPAILVLGVYNYLTTGAPYRSGYVILGYEFWFAGESFTAYFPFYLASLAIFPIAGLSMYAPRWSRGWALPLSAAMMIVTASLYRYRDGLTSDFSGVVALIAGAIPGQRLLLPVSVVACVPAARWLSSRLLRAARGELAGGASPGRALAVFVVGFASLSALHQNYLRAQAKVQTALAAALPPGAQLVDAGRRWLASRNSPRCTSWSRIGATKPAEQRSGAGRISSLDRSAGRGAADRDKRQPAHRDGPGALVGMEARPVDCVAESVIARPAANDCPPAIRLPVPSGSARTLDQQHVARARDAADNRGGGVAVGRRHDFELRVGGMRSHQPRSSPGLPPRSRQGARRMRRESRRHAPASPADPTRACRRMRQPVARPSPVAAPRAAASAARTERGFELSVSSITKIPPTVAVALSRPSTGRTALSALATARSCSGVSASALSAATAASAAAALSADVRPSIARSASTTVLIPPCTNAAAS